MMPSSFPSGPSLAMRPSGGSLTAPLIARWRSIDDELAVLVYDSDHDEAVLAHARSAESSRRLTFEGPGLRLEVEITFSRPLALVCQVVPPQPAVLEVRDGRGIVATEADSFGTFNVASLRGGPFSLRCTPSNQGCSPVATSWLRI